MTTAARPFMMIYHDCFESEVFDNYFQKIVYMTLKKFANSNNQCFPSLGKIASVAQISKRKVQNTLKELKDKFLITIQHRFREDGGQTSNLYTIYDLPELWNAGNSDNENNDNKAEVAETNEQCENDKIIPIPESKDCISTKKDDVQAEPQDKSALEPVQEIISDGAVMLQDELAGENQTAEIKTEAVSEDVEIKKERLTPEPTTVTGISTSQNKTFNKDTTPAAKSQPLEKYPLDWIKQHFGYDIMLFDDPSHQEDIDAVMAILHKALNTTKETIRVNYGDMPAMVVIEKLMKLNFLDIKYAIDKFEEQTGRIKNPTAYMLTLLYNALEQHHLDVSNSVKHDMHNELEQEQESAKHSMYDKLEQKLLKHSMYDEPE